MAVGSQVRFGYERMGLTRSPAIPVYPGLGGAQIKAWPSTGNIVDNGPGSVAAMDGIPLAGLSAVLVNAYVCNAVSQTQPISLANDTFAGGGSLVCWIAETSTSVPVRYPDLDLSFGWGGVTARATRGWPMLREVGRLGTYMWFLSNGVTMTGATPDFVVRMVGFTDVGGVH